MKYRIYLICVFIALISLFHSEGMAQYYVSVSGNNSGDGTLENPFANIERALKEIKTNGNIIDKKYKTIYIRGGEYSIRKSIILDSNLSFINIEAYKKEHVFFTGAEHIHPDSLKRIEINGKSAFYLNLKLNNIHDYGEIRSVGFSRPYGASWGEIFVNNKALHLARWPNNSMIPIGEVLETGSIPRNNDFANKGGVFKYDSLRISKWASNNDIWISGYFKWGYAEDAILIDKIDPIDKTISLAHATLYGIDYDRPFRRWYGFNILQELDQNNEFFIDKEKGELYFIVPDEEIETIEFSILDEPFFTIDQTHHINITGIHFKCARGMGITMSRTENILIKDCNFYNLGSLGISIGKGIEPFEDIRHDGIGKAKSGIIGSLQQHLYSNTIFSREAGRNNKIFNCQFYQLGAGGVSLGGGNRKTLEAGNNSVENCTFFDFNRIEKSYRPAIHITGVGNKIIKNEMFNAPSMAILLHGNNHMIENNDIHHVCLEVDDQGAIYFGRNPSERGISIQNNYFHHIPDKYSTCAVYPDDGACGLFLNNNVFYKAGRYAVLLGGGSDHIFTNNIFIDADYAIHVDNRLEHWGKNMVEPDGIFDKRLKEANTLNPPYSQAYPKLRSYFENAAHPSNNLLEDNLFFKIQDLIHGDIRYLDFQKSNLEIPRDTIIETNQLLDDFLSKRESVDSLMISMGPIENETPWQNYYKNLFMLSSLSPSEYEKIIEKGSLSNTFYTVADSCLYLYVFPGEEKKEIELNADLKVNSMQIFPSAKELIYKKVSDKISISLEENNINSKNEHIIKVDIKK